jgi:hypothetical protein
LSLVPGVQAHEYDTDAAPPVPVSVTEHVPPVNAAFASCHVPLLTVQPEGVDVESGVPSAWNGNETFTTVVEACAPTEAIAGAVHVTCSVNPLAAVPDTTFFTCNAGRSELRVAVMFRVAGIGTGGRVRTSPGTGSVGLAFPLPVPAAPTLAHP